MHRSFLLALVLSFAASPSLSQGSPPGSSITKEQREAVSDARAAETKRLIAKARKQQALIDQRNTDLWARWTFAVCIGCSPRAKGLRIVQTNPLRVLAGIPAAEDDARQRRRSLRA